MTVTKLAITLNEPGDWESWIELAKTHAEGQDIWEFINPENVRATYPSEPAYPTPVFIRQLLAEERTPQPPIAPSSRPAIPSAADSGPSRNTRSRTARESTEQDDDDNGNEPQSQGPGPIPQQQAQGPTDAEVDARMKVELMHYKHEYQAYLQQKNALKLMRTIIQNSVHATKYLQHTFNCNTAYDMLVPLNGKSLQVISLPNWILAINTSTSKGSRGRPLNLGSTSGRTCITRVKSSVCRSSSPHTHISTSLMRYRISYLISTQSTKTAYSPKQGRMRSWSLPNYWTYSEMPNAFIRQSRARVSEDTVHSQQHSKAKRSKTTRRMRNLQKPMTRHRENRNPSVNVRSQSAYAAKTIGSDNVHTSFHQFERKIGLQTQKSRPSSIVPTISRKRK